MIARHCYSLCSDVAAMGRGAILWDDDGEDDDDGPAPSWAHRAEGAKDAFEPSRVNIANGDG